MSRTSTNQLTADGTLLNGFDYTNQAWVINGIYQDCGHPQAGATIPARVDSGYNPRTGRIEELHVPAAVFQGCSCYGRQHQGERCTIKAGA